MLRRPLVKPSIAVASACMMALTACGEQVPGGLPDGGEAAAAPSSSTVETSVAQASSTPDPEPDDPIVLQIGDEQFRTIMAIYHRYDAAKNTPLALLAPLAPAEEIEGGWTQDYTAGSIYWSHGTGAQIVRGRILDAYVDSGGPSGPLGWPVRDETVEGEVILSDFEHGQIRFEDDQIRVVEERG